MLTLRHGCPMCIFALATVILAGAEDSPSLFTKGAAENEVRGYGSKASILVPEEHAALRPCQSFHWRGAPGAARHWLAIGSYPNGADLFNRDVSIGPSATVRLPADGRPIYVTLFTESGGVWRKAASQYRAPTSESPEPCQGGFRDRVGVYHWAGSGARSMSEGVDQIRQIGGRVIRLTMSPRYYRDYNIASACYESYSLAALAKEPDVARALAEPAIRVYMITAYDGVTFGDCYTPKFLNPRFYTNDNQARIAKEYSDLTYQLYRTYAGTGKKFVLSNWEGDNAVYCGAADRYVSDEAFRNWCEENYSVLYDGNGNPAESLDGLRRWFTARWEGIKDGQRRGADSGFDGVSVLAAPEFSMVRSLNASGYPSVLYDVIPAVPFDYVSYSAYESINRPNPAGQLRTDLATIREVAGADTVVLGEIGFSRSAWADATVERTHEVIEAALDWGVSFIFLWALYDHSATIDFGLIDEFGGETALGTYCRMRLRLPAPARGRESPQRTSR